MAGAVVAASGTVVVGGVSADSGAGFQRLAAGWLMVAVVVVEVESNKSSALLLPAPLDDCSGAWRRSILFCDSLLGDMALSSRIRLASFQVSASRFLSSDCSSPAGATSAVVWSVAVGSARRFRSAPTLGGGGIGSGRGLSLRCSWSGNWSWTRRWPRLVGAAISSLASVGHSPSSSSAWRGATFLGCCCCCCWIVIGTSEGGRRWFKWYSKGCGRAGSAAAGCHPSLGRSMKAVGSVGREEKG